MIEASDAWVAQRQIGLEHVDHGGLLHRNLSIIVDEFGLRRELNKGYFSIGRLVFSGNAVVYRYDGNGETRDVRPEDLSLLSKSYTGYTDAAALEMAIAGDLLDRPVMKFNGEVFWQWSPPKEKTPDQVRAELRSDYNRTRE
jgi:hypothetical protein